mmetsp:Transcript_64390/g.184959  ORF Transcript_64390/g.184959 Transcript_64390/m.184959 type:complete len:227 (-) Transcript_64390:1441-2121(-)
MQIIAFHLLPHPLHLARSQRAAGRLSRIRGLHSDALRLRGPHEDERCQVDVLVLGICRSVLHAGHLWGGYEEVFLSGLHPGPAPGNGRWQPALWCRQDTDAEGEAIGGLQGQEIADDLLPNVLRPFLGGGHGQEVLRASRQAHRRSCFQLHEHTRRLRRWKARVLPAWRVHGGLHHELQQYAHHHQFAQGWWVAWSRHQGCRPRFQHLQLQCDVPGSLPHDLRGGC